MEKLRIGEVAARAGVSVDTVRYYERVGVLSKAARRASGYRVFDETSVQRIALVKQLQALSLPLEEVIAMVSARDTSCTREATRIESALRRTEEEIASLESLRTRLRGALEMCNAGHCDLVERARSSRSRLADRRL